MANTDLYSLQASDNFRLARSHLLSEKVDGTYNIIRLPRYAFVHDIVLYVTQAYDVDGTATIGWIGNAETADPDGFMDVAMAAATQTGYKSMKDDSQPGSQGKWFNTAPGSVTITLADNTSSTLMIGYVFCWYSVLH